MNGLNARRHVDMGDCGYFRANGIQSIDPEKRLVVLRYPVAPVLADFGNDEHIRAVAIEIEPLRNVFAQHRRSERAEALAEFDLEVELPLHVGRAGIAENRPGA